MAVRIAGERMYLWRAMDDQGEVLDVLVQRRRDQAAARKLMRRLPRKQGFAPAVVTTGKLRSYGAAFAEIGVTARHEQGLRRTTGPKSRTNRSADGSGRCSASSRPAPPSASSPCTPPRTTPSTSSAT